MSDLHFSFTDFILLNHAHFPHCNSIINICSSIFKWVASPGNTSTPLPEITRHDLSIKHNLCATLLDTSIFWSSLVRTPSFDIADVSEYRFTSAYLQYFLNIHLFDDNIFLALDCCPHWPISSLNWLTYWILIINTGESICDEAGVSRIANPSSWSKGALHINIAHYALVVATHDHLLLALSINWTLFTKCYSLVSLEQPHLLSKWHFQSITPSWHHAWYKAPNQVLHHSRSPQYIFNQLVCLISLRKWDFLIPMRSLFE